MLVVGSAGGGGKCEEGSHSKQASVRLGLLNLRVGFSFL